MGRIIKIVMKHQSGEGKNTQKKHKPAVETGFEAWALWDRAVASDDIQLRLAVNPERLCSHCGGELATRQ
jgi:hypothetical protein